MTELIWRKDDADVDERIMRFMAGEDVLADRHLFAYDIAATKAHVKGLRHIDLLDDGEHAALVSALDELAEAFSTGGFVLDERYEDGHSAIESWLTERLGDVGRKVHTGRSRNDQVVVATRLYLLDALKGVTECCLDIARASLRRATREQHVPMPGYTHLQRAVVSSAGMWFGSFAEAFIDDAQLAVLTREWMNANPLGTAAGYGVNLPLDRDLSSAELGFARLQLNPMYVQNSRGKFELQALMALAQALLDLRRLAWDLSLFTTREFDLLELPERFTTGSSIMPNKRNPDLVELLRAAHPRVQGAMSEIQSLLALPSGYQRDLQGSKEPLIRAMTHGLAALALVPDLLEGITLKPANLSAAIDAGMYATDRAIELARGGVPFREAYRQAAQEMDQLGDRSPEDSLAARVSPGGAGNLRLDILEARLEALEKGLPKVKRG